jgi:hypothetical protein
MKDRYTRSSPPSEGPKKAKYPGVSRDRPEVLGSDVVAVVTAQASLWLGWPLQEALCELSRVLSKGTKCVSLRFSSVLCTLFPASSTSASCHHC